MQRAYNCLTKLPFGKAISRCDGPKNGYKCINVHLYRTQLDDKMKYCQNPFFLSEQIYLAQSEIRHPVFVKQDMHMNGSNSYERVSSKSVVSTKEEVRNTVWKI